MSTPAVAARPADPTAASPVGLALGVDVGGTKTAWVITDADDNLLRHAVEPTDIAALARQLISISRAAIDGLARGSEGWDGRRIEAIGVAIPGQVDSASGTIKLAVNLGARDLPLAALVEAGVGLPCFVEHDARAAAAWLYGRPTESPTETSSDVIYLSLGTGISAGLVLGGRALRGQNGLAGEIGHVTADPDGSRCACGLRGCLETVAAGPAIARQVSEGIAAGRPTVLADGATASDVFAAAEAGDPLALEVADRVAAHLARAIRALVLIVGAQRVVIGGGVSGAGRGLLDRVVRAIADERAASPLADAALGGVMVERLPSELEAGARGAAAIARQRMAAGRGRGVAAR
jgi:glucokinase